MEKKLSWSDVMVAQKSWGETYKNNVNGYRQLVKRMGYKYFIWAGKVMELIDRGLYLTHKDTGIKPEEL